MAEGAKGARAKLGACAAGDPNKPVGWRLSLWLLSIASVCAVSSIVGYDTGWAHFHKDHYKPKTNTYLALVLTIMGDYPDVAEKIPANLVDIVKPLLPAVNISIDIQLGWLERTTILDLHSDELSPVITNFLEKPELDPYRDQIDQVAVDRRMVMRNFYKDTGVEAQWSGAISAALLAVSILLSVSLFAAYAFTRASKGPRSVQCGRYCFMVMKLSTLLGPLLVASVIAHYVALGYGTHKRTEENIIFEEGFISWPSWACVAALLSGTMWTISGILVAKGSLPNPSTLARRSGGRTARDRGRA